MGLLEKAIAYRWVSQGRGGDDGMGPLGLVLVGLVLFFLFMLAVEAFLSFLYDTIRGVLMISPVLSTLLVGFGFALLILALTSSYSPEQASEYLSSKEDFVTNASLSVAALAIVFLATEYGPLAGPNEESGVPIISFIIVGLTCYCLYCLYQSTKLVGSLPNGSRYQLAILFPIAASIVQLTFSLPIYTPLEYLLSGGFIAALPSAIAIVYYRVKPYLDTVPTTRQDSP